MPTDAASSTADDAGSSAAARAVLLDTVLKMNIGHIEIDAKLVEKALKAGLLDASIVAEAKCEQRLTPRTSILPIRGGEE